MTRDKAIAELVRIWHSPHLDLSLKAGLGEAIEALNGADGDLISRQDAIRAVFNTSIPFSATGRTARQMKGLKRDAVGMIKSLPSAEPRTYGVLCALADRTCPFQGKEFAWCLTCPHISDEDRDLVKRAIEPKTGEWVLDGCTPICSACHEEPCWSSEGYDFTDFCPNCGARMKGGEEE